MSANDQHQYKDRYMLRLPDGMRDRIKAAAEANNRSMNAEIVAALDEKYPEPHGIDIIAESEDTLRQILMFTDLLVSGKFTQEERTVHLQTISRLKQRMKELQREMLERSMLMPNVSQRRLLPHEIKIKPRD